MLDSIHAAPVLEGKVGQRWPDAYIQLTISPHLFGLYLTTLLSIWSTSSPDARHCNTPNCKGLTFIFPCDNFWICGICDTQWCTVCHKAHNDSVSCEELHIKEKDDNMMDSLFEEGVFAKCPSCGSGVQKSEGCNHMTCSCRAHFCYCCGAQLLENNPYRHVRMGVCPLFDHDFN